MSSSVHIVAGGSNKKRVTENKMKNSNGSKTPPAQLSKTPYIGDPIFASPTTHKAKAIKPTQPKVANSGVKSA